MMLLLLPVGLARPTVGGRFAAGSGPRRSAPVRRWPVSFWPGRWRRP